MMQKTIGNESNLTYYINYKVTTNT